MDTGLRPPGTVEVLETQEQFPVRRYDELPYAEDLLQQGSQSCAPPKSVALSELRRRRIRSPTFPRPPAHR
jgi:hypothetical protein